MGAADIYGIHRNNFTSSPDNILQLFTMNSCRVLLFDGEPMILVVVAALVVVVVVMVVLVVVVVMMTVMI